MFLPAASSLFQPYNIPKFSDRGRLRVSKKNEQKGEKQRGKGCAPVIVNNFNTPLIETNKKHSDGTSISLLSGTTRLWKSFFSTLHRYYCILVSERILNSVQQNSTRSRTKNSRKNMLLAYETVQRWVKFKKNLIYVTLNPVNVYGIF